MYQKVWMTIAADNFDELVSFYQQLLAQPPQLCSPDRYAEFSLSHFRLGIFKPRSDQAHHFQADHFQADPVPHPSRPSPSPLSLCLEVPNLEQALLTSQKAGATLADQTLIAQHGREHYIYDPLGNRIILYEAGQGFS